MRVASVTIETDKGDMVTMSIEDCEKFFKAMERVKEAAKPKEEKKEETDQINFDHMRLQMEMEMRKLQMEEQQRVARQNMGMRQWTSNNTGILNQPLIKGPPSCARDDYADAASYIAGLANSA